LALKTVREQLEEVQSAISAVMAGQAYQIGGRSMTRANLSALQEREENLLKRAEAGQLDTIPGSKTTKGAYGVSFGS
jgi:hypothetical protein